LLFPQYFKLEFMPATTNAPIDAGAFGEWLAAMRAVLRGERFADVPCGDCVGCCVSFYPIPLRPLDELARQLVPAQLLIGPAEPGKRWLMGFREDGSCPFLDQECCSIYSGRPQTCRDYDCRIYAAAGLTPDGDRRAISERVHAWEFRFASDQERTEAAAVQLAANFIRSHAALFPAAMRAGSTTAVAVLAVKTHELFLDAAQTAGSDTAMLPSVQRVIEAARTFDVGSA
jgi:uncharacterized protein